MWLRTNSYQSGGSPVSFSMCLSTELLWNFVFYLRLLWRTCTIRILFLKHNLVTLSFTETAVLQSFHLWQSHLPLTQCDLKLYLLLLEPWSHDSSWQRELRGVQDRSYLNFLIEVVAWVCRLKIYSGVQYTLWHTQLHFHPTLRKKKIEFSSYIRKFRVEQLQSHVWGRAS